MSTAVLKTTALVKAADAAATLSIGSAATSYLSGANEIAQFVAAIVAIVAGIFAIVVHLKKLRDK